MKNFQFVSRLMALTLICGTALLFGCNKEENGPGNEETYWLEANLLMGNQLFINTLKGRSSENVFEVQEVIRKNELLEVKVKGGGDAESFQFIWDGRIQESFPMGIRLILQYDNSNQDFNEDREMSVAVNLYKIIGDRANVDDYHFYVINGSQIQTVTLNPDGTSTNEQK